MTKRPYREVPVAEAKRIAEQFDKEMVIINAYDDRHRLTHTTTYGKTPQQKEIAADAGERTARALGCALEAKKSYEDFRYRTAAEAAIYLETLRAILQWCDISDGTNPREALDHISRNIDTCLKAIEKQNDLPPIP